MENNRLTEILTTQQALLEELLNLLKREAGEMADIRLPAMAEINTLKEGLMARLEAGTGELREALSAAVAREGLPAGSSLGDLAGKLKQQGQGALARLHGSVNQTAGQVRQALGLNRDIAERFAGSVSTSLELLTRVVKQSNVYGARGGYQQRPVSSVMINREA